MSSWIAAGTSYTNHDLEMIPIYIFYSMFGFQRIGDLAWAAGDSQARGFLIGATAGRTTLAGEGFSIRMVIVICWLQTFLIVLVMIRLLHMKWLLS